MTTTTTLPEAYERLHRFGPEYGGDEEGNHGMTNHGPMAVEVLARRGLDVDVDQWLDRYVPRLSDLPRPAERIAHDAWQSALGSARRLPDWTDLFERELADRPWVEVLTTWWPRLLPGIIAGSTHGVIRVGHAVRALRAVDLDTPDPAVLHELAHGLAFWAARYRELREGAAPSGQFDAAAAVPAVARISDQTGLIAHRIARLERSPHWPSSLAALQGVERPDDVPHRLEQIVEEAAALYPTIGYGAPVLLVHAATAPNAVRHVLPALPSELWTVSFSMAWAASAAVIAMYAPAATPGAPRADRRALTSSSTLERAAAHGDEHVLKFTDTAVEAFDRTQNPALLAAAQHAADLISQP